MPTGTPGVDVSSAKRFEVLLASGSVGQVDTDLGACLVRVNTAFAEMLGRPAADLLGRSVLRDLLHELDQAAWRDRMPELLAGVLPVLSAPLVYRHADGSPVHTEITLAVLRDDDGAARHLTALVVDVTEQVLARDELDRVQAELQVAAAAARRQAATLEAVLHAISEGVVAVDAAGRLLIRNRAAEALLPLDAAQTVDAWHSTHQVMRGDGVTPLPQEAGPMARALCGEVCEMELVLPTATRAEGIPVWVHAQPLAVDEGRPGAVVVLRDLSMDKLADADLREQKLRLQAILDATADAFVGMDSAGLVREWNPAAEALFGWSAEEALGQELALLIVPAAYRAAHRAGFARFVATGVRTVRQTIEVPALRRDGSEVLLELSLSPLQTPTGGWHWYAFLRDVGERRRAEQKTRALAQVVESSDDAIYVRDLDGVVTSWNAAAERLYGYRGGEAIGTHMLQLVPGENAEALTELGRAVARTGRTQQLETQLITKSGRRIDVGLRKAPLVDEFGVRVGWVTAARDISDRLRIQAELRRSEEVFRSAFDEALCGMILFAPDGRLTRVNQVFASMLGAQPADLMGVHVSELTRPDHDDDGDDLLRRALDGELTSFATEQCYRHADGSPVWAKLSASLIRDAGGAPLYFAAQTVDISERLRAERERDTRNLMLQGVITNSQSLIYVKDLDGRYSLVNEPFERAFSVTEAELLGKDDTYVDAAQAPAWRANDLRAQQEEYHVQEWSEGPHGRRHYASVKFPLRDPDGVVYATCGVSLDVTATRVAAEGMARARDEALSANAAKSRFLAAMSHEIRTPMNAVIGMTGLLLATQLDADQREFAETVRDSGDALLDVINEILDFSKIESGDLDLEQQPFSMRECMESALSLISLTASRKGLELIGRLDDDVPDTVVGDVTRLRQVIVNLTNNAVKFTDTGEVLVTVGVERTERDRTHLAVTVIDTGIGIPADRMDRLFQSFSQLDSSTTRVYGGTGLGLAISRRLAEAMGGTLTVRSEPGVGSTFTLTVALAVQPDRRPAPVLPQELAGFSVLVVDDNATNRRVLRHQLECWGMACTESAGPAQALAWIAAGQQFDLALVDMHMPGSSGVELAHAMRQLPAARNLPLVLLTGMDDLSSSAESAHVAAVLSKPTRQSALLATLTHLLVPAEAALHSLETAGGNRREDGPPTPARVLKILVADDNLVNQKVAQQMLAKLGHRVDTVANGLEAVAAVRQIPYDVVLMDVQMPEMDGLGATRHIRSELALERQPRIVAMTANVLAEARTACLESGMDGYLSKPVRMQDLVEALEQVPVVAVHGPLAKRTPVSPVPPTRAAQPSSALGLDPAVTACVAGLQPRLEDLRGADAEEDREFLLPMFDSFSETSAAQLDALDDALARGSIIDVEQQAHALKGSAGNLGAVVLAALCEELETLAAGGQAAPAGMLERLRRERHVATQALRVVAGRLELAAGLKGGR